MLQADRKYSTENKNIHTAQSIMVVRVLATQRISSYVIRLIIP